MTVREFVRRLQILAFFRQKGIKKTQRKYGVYQKQLDAYEAQEQQMKDAIAAAEQKDAKRNAKRKGKESHASVKRAKKRQRIDKPGPERKELYVWLDARILSWFTAARAAKFLITSKMIRIYAAALTKSERNATLPSLPYWYRSFCAIHKVKVRKITGLRRKQYTPEELARVTTQYYGFIRYWKSIHRYPSSLIINMDEIPTYMDMLRGNTMDFVGKGTVEARYTNYDKKRYTVNAAVAGNGAKLPISCIWRSTKKGKAPRWDKQKSPCKRFYTKGGSQTVESMLAWLKEILIPYIVENGGGKDSDQWALFIIDPAPAHKHPKVKAFLKKNKVRLAMMPASTTYKFQMIDVVVGKPFKDAMCDKWADWMLKNQNEVTAAGNYKHPERIDCVRWVSEVWDDLSMAGVIKKAADLGMTADLGPEIAGYKRGDDVVDLEPSGAEIDVLLADISDDLEAEL